MTTYVPDPPCDHWLPNPGTNIPRNATWIYAQFPRAGRPREEVVHWADGGGEEQPPYRGWFIKGGPNYFNQVHGEPWAWRPLKGMCVRCLQPLPEIQEP